MHLFPVYILRLGFQICYFFFKNLNRILDIVIVRMQMDLPDLYFYCLQVVLNHHSDYL